MSRSNEWASPYLDEYWSSIGTRWNHGHEKNQFPDRWIDGRRPYLRVNRYKGEAIHGGHMTPPNSFRRRWRQEYRTHWKQQMRVADWDNWQNFPMNRVTSIYDWY